MQLACFTPQITLQAVSNYGNSTFQPQNLVNSYKCIYYASVMSLYNELQIIYKLHGNYHILFQITIVITIIVALIHCRWSLKCLRPGLELSWSFRTVLYSAAKQINLTI